MKFHHRPGFYMILLLLAALLGLTLWLDSKLDTVPLRKVKQETAPAYVSPRP